MNFFTAHAILLVWSVAGGAIVSLLWTQIKRISDWVNALPSQVHVYVMGAISILWPFAVKFVPGLPPEITSVTQATIAGLLTLLVNQITHAATPPVPPAKP